jgi:predicted P-loop ATPase
VNGDASTLYQQVWSVDAEPTASQTEAVTKVETEAADVLKRWQEFKSTDLEGLNRQLKESNTPEIQPETEHPEEPQADEE